MVRNKETRSCWEALAVNGVYQGSVESYIPLSKVLAISNVFIAISSIGGFLLCSVIGMLIGIAFAQR